jgi:hypothetical protein
MKKEKYVEPAAGTIRGPFVCGKGVRHDGGVQFLVKMKSGAWCPFIGERIQEGKLRKEAEEFAQNEIKN